MGAFSGFGKSVLEASSGRDGLQEHTWTVLTKTYSKNICDTSLDSSALQSGCLAS